MLEHRKLNNELARQILMQILQEALVVVGLFEVHTQEDLMVYISLRLALYQTLSKPIIDRRAREVVRIRKFEALHNNFMLILTTSKETVETVVILSPAALLGDDNRYLVFPKLFMDDRYGVATPVLVGLNGQRYR